MAGLASRVYYNLESLLSAMLPYASKKRYESSKRYWTRMWKNHHERNPGEPFVPFRFKDQTSFSGRDEQKFLKQQINEAA